MVTRQDDRKAAEKIEELTGALTSRDGLPALPKLVFQAQTAEPRFKKGERKWFGLGKRQYLPEKNPENFELSANDALFQVAAQAWVVELGLKTIQDEIDQLQQNNNNPQANANVPNNAQANENAIAAKKLEQERLQRVRLEMMMRMFFERFTHNAPKKRSLWDRIRGVHLVETTTEAKGRKRLIIDFTKKGSNLMALWSMKSSNAIAKKTIVDYEPRLNNATNPPKPGRIYRVKGPDPKTNAYVMIGLIVTEEILGADEFAQKTITIDDVSPKQMKAYMLEAQAWTMAMKEMYGKFPELVVKPGASVARDRRFTKASIEVKEDEVRARAAEITAEYKTLTAHAGAHVYNARKAATAADINPDANLNDVLNQSRGLMFNYGGAMDDEVNAELQYQGQTLGNVAERAVRRAAPAA